jgi:hypothetical protein
MVTMFGDIPQRGTATRNRSEPGILPLLGWRMAAYGLTAIDANVADDFSTASLTAAPAHAAQVGSDVIVTATQLIISS